MRGYLLRRLAFAAFLVFAVSSASLLLTRLAPGDYTVEVLGIGASAEDRAALRARTGLDRPLAAQYADWLSRAVRFDFGTSLAYGRPVGDLIADRAWYTALLAATSLLLATVVGIPLGVVTGARAAREAWTRGSGRVPRRASPLGTGAVRSISGLAIVLLSAPPLLTALALVFVAARTGWLPAGGAGSLEITTQEATVLARAFDLARHMVVPVLALGLPLAAMFERLQSQAMREALAQPFIVAALARGISPRRIVWRHALKASLKPVASIYGLVAGTLLSGSFAVEIVTAWPGLGRLMLDALRARDVYLVAGCGAAAAVLLAAGTLLSDVALAVVDPRTRDA